MASACCASVLNPGLLGQSIFTTVATQAALNSRGTWMPGWSDATGLDNDSGAGVGIGVEQDRNMTNTNEVSVILISQVDVFIMSIPGCF